MDKCFHCLEDIPLNACCQPFLVDGIMKFFHVGCLEPWYDEEIRVWRVRLDRQSYVSLEAPVLEEGSGETLTRETMKRGKFYALKEFTGF